MRRGWAGNMLQNELESQGRTLACLCVCVVCGGVCVCVLCVCVCVCVSMASRFYFYSVSVYEFLISTIQFLLVKMFILDIRN